MLVETVLSMLTLVCPFEKGDAFEAGGIFRRAWRFTMAASMCWSSGMVYSPTRSGFVPLSIAEFSL